MHVFRGRGCCSATSYEDTASVINHLEQIHKENRDLYISCLRECKLVVSYGRNWRAKLEKHMSSYHGEDAMRKPVTCEDCGKHFRKKTDLKKHMSSCHKGDSVTGKHCGKHSRKKTDLEKHISPIHEEDSVHKPVTCGQCGKHLHKKLIWRIICHQSTTKTRGTYQ